MSIRLKFERDNPDLYVMRARLNQLTNQMTAAYHDVNSALALDPDHKVGSPLHPDHKDCLRNKEGSEGHPDYKVSSQLDPDYKAANFIRTTKQPITSGLPDKQPVTS